MLINRINKTINGFNICPTHIEIQKAKNMAKHRQTCLKNKLKRHNRNKHK